MSIKVLKLQSVSKINTKLSMECAIMFVIPPKVNLFSKLTLLCTECIARVDIRILNDIIIKSAQMVLHLQ